MLITQEIHNLIAGISQQPPISRHPEQLQEQINGFSSEIGGLQKRPPTLLVKPIETIPKTSKVHFIDRDLSEQYCVALTGNEVKVWDIKGNPKSVRYEGNTKNYISCVKPREQLKVVTVADYSFILNTTKKVTTTNTTSPNTWATQGVLVNIKAGQYGRKYEVIINGKSLTSFETPDGSRGEHAKQIDTNYIAQKLAENIGVITRTIIEKTVLGKEVPREVREVDSNPLGSGIKVRYVLGSSWLYIRAEDAQGNNKIETFDTKDGFNNQSMKAFHTKAQHFHDLPQSAPQYFTVLISGESSKSDDYYLRYDGEIWVETTKPNLKNELDRTTLPVALVRESNGNFVVKELEWSPRLTGDNDSNPLPSFVNKTINDIFFFRNRLGFTSGESVNLSKSGDYFNFFIDSATDVVDTDPLDISVSHNKISNLSHAIPFNQDLYIFSANTQFLLHADGTLSPKNVRIDQVTEFDSDTNVRPIGVGRNLYYTSKRLEYTTISEYTAVYDNGIQRDSQDITAHVPSLIVNGVYDLLANPNEHLIIALSEGAKGVMYVYKYLYLNDSKVQSSWGKWEFNGDIIGADFIGSTIYIVICRNNRCFLEKLNITYNTEDFRDEPYRVFLDRKQEITIRGTFEPQNRLFKLPLLSDYEEGKNYSLVLSDGRVFKTNKGVFECNTTDTLEGLKAYIGEDYRFTMELTTIYLKETQQGSTKTIPNYRLNIRNINVNYADTGEFNVNISYVGKQERNYKFTSRIVGTDSNKLNIRPITTGQFRVPVQGRNTDIKIAITNDTPLPSAITSIVWEGLMTTRYRSV